MLPIKKNDAMAGLHTKCYSILYRFNTILLCFLVFVCLTKSAYADALDDVVKSGVLRVGVSLYEPWAYKDDQGHLNGFEIQMARQLASDLGVEPKFIITEWPELISSLESKKIDIIVSGMAITPERALRVNFSNPYANSGIDLAASLLKTKHIKSLEELNNPKVVIGVVSKTVSEKLAKNFFGQATIKSFNTFSEVRKSILNGELHVWIDSAPIPRYLALEHPDKIDNPLSEPLVSYKVGMAINKNEQEFLNYLNAWIIARDADGWISSKHKFWFESLEWKHK